MALWSKFPEMLKIFPQKVYVPILLCRVKFPEIKKLLASKFPELSGNFRKLASLRK